MVVRETDRSNVLIEVIESDRPRVVNERAEEPMTFGEMPDLLDLGV
jgi:hypothetical protein